MVFIGSYTNEVKSYCDKMFFDNLWKIVGNNSGLIVDNTQGTEYYEKLKDMSPLPVVHIEPQKTNYQFQVNVNESLALIRQTFINSKADYLLLIESDVLPPVDIVERLTGWMKAISEQTKSNPGIVGAWYYQGFQKWSDQPYQINHVLSGCTLYRREVVEQYPFRINLQENPGAFPDAWICYDVNIDREYSLWNVPIKCRHQHTIINGRLSRGHELLKK